MRQAATADVRRAIIDQWATRDVDNVHVRDWLDALRSGDYTQATGAMRVETYMDPYDEDDDPSGYDEDGKRVGHCCLGVACELARITLEESDSGYGVPTSLINYDSDPDAYPGEDQDLGHMPTWLRELLGISWDDEGHLAKLNDSGSDFSLIADVIELAYRAQTEVGLAAERLADRTLGIA